MKRRILSLLLAFVILASSMPVSVFAEESTDTTVTSAETQTETKTETETETETEAEIEAEAETESACPTCGSVDCSSDHTNWCDICRKDNCGQTHCPTCGAIDCTTEHKTCEKCGAVDCTTDHTNWCDICKMDSCGESHIAVTSEEKTVDNCPYCEDTLAEDGSVVHAYGCNAEYVYDGSSDIGKYAQLIPDAGPYTVSENLDVSDGIMDYDEFEEGTIFKIIGWYWDAGDSALWYRVEFYSGGVVAGSADYWPDDPWILQDYTDTTYDYEPSLRFVDTCSACGKPACTTEHKQCEYCESYDCTKLHFWCDRCNAYDCGKPHLVCPACEGEVVDCERTHTFCGYCNSYDCGITHNNEPATAPIIPTNPTLSGADVSITDENGALVSGGFDLYKGIKSSLSAWSNLGSSYKWQVCVDGQWVDIQGQTGSGLLTSAAMFLQFIAAEGSAMLRCQVSNGEEVWTSAEIPVNILDLPKTASSASTSGAETIAETGDDESSDAPQKVNIVVNYIFTDNSIAANPWIGTLPAGEAYTTGTPITVPTIPGYTPQVGESANSTAATLNGQQLSLSFTAEELANDCIINIVYQPAPVKVLVNHYWQNVDNDNYTLHETVETYLVTGTKVGDVHKTYEGFYSLLYEHPTVAADSSTIVDVYYDRYYYLMTFDLSGGYGMDAIYARYGTPIVDPGEPSRPGYTHKGWTLDDNPAAVLHTMPARNITYVAIWAAEMTTYDVVFWYENADNDNYAQAGVINDVDVDSGTIVNGSDYKNTAFDGRDDKHFIFSYADEAVEINGDGSTVINVYFSRNVYNLKFVMSNSASGCSVPIHASHTDDCYTLACDKAHVHDDSCNKIQTCDHLHYHNGTTCYLIIQRKYDADISDVWENNPVKSVTNDGYVFQSSETSDYYSFLEKMPGQNITMTKSSFSGRSKYTWYYYLEVLPGVDTTGLSTRTDRGKTYYLYHTSSVYARNLNLTYDEDYFPITGFTQRDNQVPSFYNRTAYLYYTRNKYNLSFSNFGESVSGKGGTMYYQADISNQFFEPDYPENLEDGAYRFEGWYTSPFFGGSKFEFTTTNEDGTVENATMPAEDITLYANWVPVSRTVRFFLDKSDMDNGLTIPEKMAKLYADTHDGVEDPNNPYSEFATKDNVSNKSYLPELSTPGVSAGYESHPYSGYTFVGWFYLEDGVERAFDPKNMPVTHDLDLYGKWSSNVLCPFEVCFILDENGNGVLDDDEKIKVADPITGSTLAGNSRTFDAKGDTALYAEYQSGYYPNVASHTIDLKAKDDDNDGQQDTTVFIFLYKQGEPVPYTVRYLEAGTENVLSEQVSHTDNNKAVVTENFKAISGYMPDAYQKTLVVVPGGENVITFWYTKDEQHALYQVNHYIQNLEGTGWLEYRSATFTGEIDKVYSATSDTITGFSFSDELTKKLNTVDKINGYTGTKLPGAVSFIAETDTVSGKLTVSGMQLNLYYTRDQYPYQIYFLEYGTDKVLKDTINENAAYGALISHTADSVITQTDTGIEFELYDTEPETKTMTIKIDKLEDGTVSYNKLIFYYKRCTQNLTVTKKVTGEDVDTEQKFDFTVTIDPEYSFHQDSYAYGDGKYLSPVDGVLSFSLKHGESITIKDLPTAEYTVKEVNIPTGYYADIDADTDGEQTSKYIVLTKEAAVAVNCTNTFEPANLTVSKTVNVVEGDSNTPEVEAFAFTITVPSGVTGSYDYTIGDTTDTATVTDGKMAITLQNGQTATFLNLPVGEYTVTETDYNACGYDSNYKVTGGADYTEGCAAPVTLARNTTTAVEFMNKFPVGDLVIEKTVRKEFYGTAWSGDTFTFTVERTTEDRPLLKDNQYKVLLDGVEQQTRSVVDASGKLNVTITFDEKDAVRLDEAEEQGATGKHTLTIKNLPAGTYSVTEGEDTAYVQAPDGLTVSGLVIPTSEAKAEFTNQLIRKTGELCLEKELVAATGFNPDELPQGTKFSFTVALREGVPAEDRKCTLTYSTDTYTDGTAAPTSVTMSNGVFKVELEAGQNVTINGLPEGKYRITEATVPSYANSFAHKVNGNWVVQNSTTTADGQMYTEIDVADGANAEVKCTNTYPVDRAELIIQKLVTKEYDRDALPDDSFTFTVTLTEGDAESYSYTIYESDGTKTSTGTAAVTNKVFTVTLKAGQYVVIPEMPVCGYTVSETEDTDYETSYKVYVVETGESASTEVKSSGTVDASGTGTSVTRTFAAGNTDALVFTNEYKKHLGKLTINKTAAGGSADDSFIFHISGEGVDMDVTITGSGSVTIYDLPLGEYTVTEDTSWSWRYTASGFVASDTISLDDLDAEVSFTNTYEKNQWLDYAAVMNNVFSKNS